MTRPALCRLRAGSLICPDNGQAVTTQMKIRGSREHTRPHTPRTPPADGDHAFVNQAVSAPPLLNPLLRALATL